MLVVFMEKSWDKLKNSLLSQLILSHIFAIVFDIKKKKKKFQELITTNLSLKLSEISLKR